MLPFQPLLPRAPVFRVMLPQGAAGNVAPRFFCSKINPPDADDTSDRFVRTDDALNEMGRAVLWDTQALFDSLGMNIDAGELVVNYSIAQQQLIEIAKALSLNAEIILMDEPTSALDPISTSKIEDLVIELKKQYTIVMVTHNMQQAVRVSDKTVFFLLGEVIEAGDTEKLFSIPQDKRTEDYITGRFG